MAANIQKFVDTGQSDPLFLAWDVPGIMERLKQGHDDSVTALVEEVKRRTEGVTMPAGLAEVDPVSFGRTKADFVTHEIAHVFHNSRRDAAGLEVDENRKVLLELQYTKREQFLRRETGTARNIEASAQISSPIRSGAGCSTVNRSPYSLWLPFAEDNLSGGADNVRGDANQHRGQQGNPHM